MVPDSVVEDGVCSVTAVSSCDAFAAWLVVCPFALVFHPVDDRCCVFIFDGAVEVDRSTEGAAADTIAESVELSCVDTSVSVLHTFCPSDARLELG